MAPSEFVRRTARLCRASPSQSLGLDGPKPDQTPVAMEFLARPFDEAVLLEIASAYEAGTKHRRPSKVFRLLKDEP